MPLRWNNIPHKEIKGIPSVTQIIGILEKPFLYRWYGSLGYEECERIKRESAEYGTRMHEHVSRYLKGQETDEPFIHPFIREYKCKPVEVEPEEPYQSKKYKYQGTFDWIDKEGDELIVNDLKVTSQIHKENALQLAAYAQLYNEKHGTKINKGRIYRLDKKTGKLQIKQYDDLKPYFKIFKLLIPVFNWVRGKNG